MTQDEGHEVSRACQRLLKKAGRDGRKHEAKFGNPCSRVFCGRGSNGVRFDVGAAPERIEQIVQAVQILVTSPLIGRPVKGSKRELVIGRGSQGYVALYRYVVDIDTVFVLAVRSERESGVKGGALNRPNCHNGQLGQVMRSSIQEAGNEPSVSGLASCRG